MSDIRLRFAIDSTGKRGLALYSGDVLKDEASRIEFFSKQVFSNVYLQIYTKKKIQRAIRIWGLKNQTDIIKRYDNYDEDILIRKIRCK